VSRYPFLAAAAAFVVLAFETLAHRQLLFVRHSLAASTVLAIAMMGIALGSMATYGLTRKGIPRRLPTWAALGLGGSVLLNIGAFVVLGEYLDVAVPLLLLPYAFGGLLISLSFAAGNAPRVYFLDLTGAGLGVILLAAAIPWLREEGCQLALAGLAVGTVVLTRPPRILGLGAGVIAAVILGLAVTNPATGFYDITTDINPTMRNRSKIFNRIERMGGEVLMGASSIAGRTDVVSQKRRNGTTRYGQAENGNPIDTLRDWPKETYLWDPRVPRGVVGERPSVFIIGTSGEGVLKTSVALGGRVVGAEINPASYRTIRGPAAGLCANCYEGVEVTIGDGRTVLERSDERFEIITMMNAHIAKGRTWRGRASDPEFIHTKEAIGLYLDRLTDPGVIVWEEPTRSTRGGQVTTRIVMTAMAALRDRGAEQPEDHVVVFGWSQTGSYHQILVRKTPWEGESLAAVRRWLAKTTRVRRGVDGPIRARIEPLWFPDRPELDNPLADLLAGRGLKEGWPEQVRVPITDDRPFPFHLEPIDPSLFQSFGWVLGVGALMVFGPIGWLVRRRQQAAPGLPLLLGVGGLLGMGYLFVEIVFINNLQILLGSPVVSFVVVLGGMLILSGLGGLLGGRLSRRGYGFALVALPVVLGLSALLIPAASKVAIDLSNELRVVLALVVIAPAAMLMGLPFPRLIEDAKSVTGTGAAAALVFGVNGGCSAIGGAGGHVAATLLGFSGTYAVACGIYVLAVAGIFLAERRMRAV